MATMMGSLHQGHLKYIGAGRQCVCNSMVSMLHAQDLNPKKWTPSDIDAILEEGDKMFVMLQDSQGNNHQHLLISDIPEAVIYRNHTYKMEIHQVWSGTLDRHVSEKPFMTLEDSMKGIKSFSFLTVGCYTTAILKCEQEFFVFDPHSRNELGMSCPDGYAILSSHKNVESLCLFIRHLAATLTKQASVAFETTHVDFLKTKMSCKVHEESSDEFEGFSEVTDGEYACILCMMNENLKTEFENIENLSFSDEGLGFLSVSENSLKQCTETSDRSDEIFIAEKLVNDFVSAPENINKDDTELNIDMNDSFVDRVIQEGLMNESNDFSINFDLLNCSGDDEDVPLSVIKSKILTQKSYQETTVNSEHSSESEMLVNGSESDKSDSQESTANGMMNSKSPVNETSVDEEDPASETHTRGRKRLRHESMWKRSVAISKETLANNIRVCTVKIRCELG